MTANQLLALEQKWRDEARVTREAAGRAQRRGDDGTADVNFAFAQNLESHADELAAALSQAGDWVVVPRETLESCVGDAIAHLNSDAGWDDYGTGRRAQSERYVAMLAAISQSGVVQNGCVLVPGNAAAAAMLAAAPAAQEPAGRVGHVGSDKGGLRDAVAAFAPTPPTGDVEALELALRDYQFASVEHGRTGENAIAVDAAEQALKALIHRLASAPRAAPAVMVDEAMVERAAKAMACVRVPLVDDDNGELPVVDALAGALGDEDVGRAQEVLWSMAEDALTAALGQGGGR